MKRTVMNAKSTLRLVLAGISVASASAFSVSNSSAAGRPETVLVTFHVKQGKADELNQVLWQSWATYERLALVLPEPHIVARSTEDDGTVTFFELFSWKNHAVPDRVPNEV